MTFLIALHVIAGTIALGALPIAIGSSKGHKIHRFAGRTYGLAMTAALVLACLISIINRDPFLGLLALLTAYLLLTGVRFARLRSVDDLARARILAATMLALAVMMMGYGIYRLLHGQSDGGALVAFACIGGASALQDVRRRSWPSGEERIAVHLARMGGSAIATCTAVFVVNAGELVQPAIVLWLLPTFVGVPAIVVNASRVRSRSANRLPPAVQANPEKD